MDPRCVIDLGLNRKLVSTQPFRNGNMISSTAQLFFLTEGACGIDFLSGLKTFQVVPGCLSRWPDRLENTSIDDYLSAACLRSFAISILAYGKSTWGFFDVFAPFKSWNWKQFIFRFPGFFQHVKLSATGRMNLIDSAIWAATLTAAAFKSYDNEDGWMQSHLMVLVYENAKKNGFVSLMCETAIARWRLRKPKTFEIVAKYIGTQDHDLVEAWRKYD